MNVILRESERVECDPASLRLDAAQALHLRA